MKIKLFLFLIITIKLIDAKSDLVQAEKEAPGKSDIKKNEKLTPIKTTLFVNGRVNNIILSIIDNKNISLQKNLKIGQEYRYHHHEQSIKKVICSERNSPNATINKNDLDTNSAFVFNVDKIEKYNFINIHQKQMALKQARDSKNESLFETISEQTIYNP
jgi:hypothetical protein